MPRLRPNEVAAALEAPSRTPAQLANDARLRARRGKSRAAITSDDLTGAKSETDISATGPLKVEHSSIEVVPASKMEAKARELKFMNQIVTVQIEASEDPDEPVWIHSGNGGTDQYLQRGVPQQIKLMFLYSLIAAKKDGANQFIRQRRHRQGIQQTAWSYFDDAPFQCDRGVTRSTQENRRVDDASGVTP